MSEEIKKDEYWLDAFPSVNDSDPIRRMLAELDLMLDEYWFSATTARRRPFLGELGRRLRVKADEGSKHKSVDVCDR